MDFLLLQDSGSAKSEDLNVDDVDEPIQPIKQKKVSLLHRNFFPCLDDYFKKFDKHMTEIILMRILV